jgi:hypothetical protein
MKKQLQFLSIMLMVSFMQSCAPSDTVTPDTGDVRDKYTGTWLFLEDTPKSSLSSSFMVVITRDPSNSGQVLLSNFGNPGPGINPAYGIATAGSITVPSQYMASDWMVDGSGSLRNAGIMDWTYSITAGGDHTAYHAIATKQ